MTSFLDQYKDFVLKLKIKTANGKQRNTSCSVLGALRNHPLRVVVPVFVYTFVFGASVPYGI